MSLFTHQSQPLPPPPHSPHHPTFPIIAVAIIGILATAFLLVSYYVFVIKCCLNWHRIDLLRRFSFSRRRRRRGADSADRPEYSPPPPQSRGLNDAAIRSIPLFIFKSHGKPAAGNGRNTTATECAVCLNEFHDGEKLRIIPNCAHFFHIDCIDVWLQNNANCPLCRTSISPNSNPFLSQIPQNPQINTDDDFLVIEIEPNHRNRQHRANPIIEIDTRTNLSASTKPAWKKSKKLGPIGSMGDEWIDTDRNKDEQFAVQPIRRSFSMDSAGDTQLCLAVQAIMQRHGGHGSIVDDIMRSPSEGSSRGKKSFFSFGQGKGASRSAVQPVSSEP